ncbi:MAG: ABC transporter ATP-binding protein [Planctomycetota bacterium]
MSALSTSVAESGTAPATGSIIELENISKVYGTEENPLPVLHRVCLRVERGEQVAIIGPSGSGKSTLMNIIGCLDRPTSGSYRFVGENVSKLPDLQLSRFRNRRIGFVFQSFQLIPHLSVLENIELPLFYSRRSRHERRERCRQLAENVGLGPRASHLPSELSGGECQRTAIARALANDPDLLLADEPTGNLDSRTSEDILHLVDSLHEKGHTIVMITHDMNIARASARRVELMDGHIERDVKNEDPS